MSKMISKYDIVISPDSDPLVQRTIEVDAIDPETACDLTRFVFRHSIRIVSITAHRERRYAKTNRFAALFMRFGKCTKVR